MQTKTCEALRRFKTVINSINARLPASSIGKPTDGDGYMIVARDLLQGVEALSTLSNVPPRNCALIAAHALECALKAFLWHKGKRKELKTHDLGTLWDETCKEGLDIPQEKPDWCGILASGHGPNFYFRYQKGDRGTVVHGGQTPALVPMSAELKELIGKVECAVKG